MKTFIKILFPFMSAEKPAAKCYYCNAEVPKSKSTFIFSICDDCIGMGERPFLKKLTEINELTVA